MSSHVEQIKEKLSIVDVVSSYVELEKAGANYKIKCPFHNEKTASCFISPARNSYYCFGCGAKGDIFTFTQEFEGLDFVGALRVLAKRAGVEITRENPTLRTERERLFLVLEHATLFYQRQLGTHIAVREYLKKRGLQGETAHAWRLGYAPNEWKALLLYLTSKGVRPEDAEKVGLVKKSEKVKGDYYDRFRGRVMFPIFDASGRVVAFSGRQFESDGTEAKYINSPETPLFEKSKILYGFDKAKLEIRKQDSAILVEGQMDLLMCHQAGFSNTVASSGTALTNEQLEIIRRLSRNLIIAYDADEAGQHAALRGFELALALGMDIKIVTIRSGKDPADLILENPALFKTAVQSARHIIDVELERIIKNNSEDRRALGLVVERELLPYVALIESPIEKSHFISKIAHEAELKEEAVWQSVRKILDKSLNTRQSDVPHVSLQSSHAVTKRQQTSPARALFAVIYWQEKEKKPHEGLDIRADMCNIMGTGAFDDLEKNIALSRDELVFEAEILVGEGEHLPELVSELLTRLKEEYLRQELSSLMFELGREEKNKNSDSAAKILKRCQEISLELRMLTREKQKRHF